MMFDTLVSSLSDDGDDFIDDNFEIFKGSKSACEDILKKTSYFDNIETEEKDREATRDPILNYLHRYYNDTTGNQVENQMDSLTDSGELSWDECDIPSVCIKVWSFNDFMGQYNQLYAWLNTIQVQYHSAKKAEGSSPKVENLLKNLDRDVETREHFLRESSRMVTAYSELDEEVSWRVEHVIAKWDMLSKLRMNPRKGTDHDISDIYHDIELEVRSLRSWLKAMEQRIDPLQFNKISNWSTREREHKMAEYQVLQTDIESHGRIVKLVLGLCDDLTKNPGLYDLQHAVKIAKGLERRWHQIWLQNLEWQCLLEQWIQEDENGDFVTDTDDEPLTKVQRLQSSCASLNMSPATTLLRRKKRKRWIETEVTDDLLTLEPANRKILSSQRLKHNQFSDNESNAPSDQGKEEYQFGINSNSSTIDQEITLFEESQLLLSGCLKSSPLLDSFTAIENDIKSFKNHEEEIIHPITSTPITKWRGSLNTNLEFSSLQDKCQLREIGKDNPNQSSLCGYYVYESNQISSGFNVTSDFSDSLNDSPQKISWESAVSQDSLEQEGLNKLNNESYSISTGNKLTDEISLVSSWSSEPERLRDHGVHKTPEHDTVSRSQLQKFDILNFGDDYRVFIDSLSDSSSCSRKVVNKTKKYRRKSKKKEVGKGYPYESQSDRECEVACKLISDSQKQIHLDESRADVIFSKGFVQNDNHHDYETILESCSNNINTLFEQLETLSKKDSFISQKKCREVRLLTSRWENLLEKVSDNVNNSKVFEELLCQSKTLKEVINKSFDSTYDKNQFDCNDNGDLEMKILQIKDEIENLEMQKMGLSQLNKAVQHFLGELGNSSVVEDNHINLAQQLKEDIIGLNSHWENCHIQTSKELIETEEAITLIRDLEKELLDLQRSLQTDNNLMKQKQNQKKVQNQISLKYISSSGDSGISDGSSGFFSEYDLPFKQKKLSKLQQMAKKLEDILGPTAPSLLKIAKSLEATSSEINDLERTFLKEKKISKKKMTKSKQILGVKKTRKSSVQGPVLSALVREEESMLKLP